MRSPDEPHPPGTEEDIFDSLLTFNRLAFDRRRFNTAYHLLAAALQWAQAEEDEQRLTRVGELAREQLAWIDQHAPEYEHSSRSSRQRGYQPSIFEHLTRRAETAARIVQQNRRRQERWSGLP